MQTKNQGAGPDVSDRLYIEYAYQIYKRMELIEKIQKWGEMSPEILTLIRIRTIRCYVLRYFVVVDDHLHFIRKIGWIGNFGPVNNFHVKEISDNFHYMSILYDSGGRATFLFLENRGPVEPPTYLVRDILVKEANCRQD